MRTDAAARAALRERSRAMRGVLASARARVDARALSRDVNRARGARIERARARRGLNASASALEEGDGIPAREGAYDAVRGRNRRAMDGRGGGFADGASARAKTREQAREEGGRRVSGNGSLGRRDAEGNATREQGVNRGERARGRGARPSASGVSARGEREVTLTRGLILNKLVVTRASGARLGTACELWVDTDELEVVAMDIRENAFVGAVDHVLLESLRQVGDVILVHDESAVERRWSSYGYSTVVGKDVVTESGQFIGRVRDFEFDPEDGAIARLIVDAWGVPTVPEGVVSTYAVDIGEVIRCGQERIIVAEDAESRVEQLSVSVLQRLSLTVPPWEEDMEMYGDPYYDDYYVENGRGVSRTRRAEDEYAAFAERRRRDERGAPAPAPQARSRAREGIPLVRPTQPYERRDSDGGYGDRPGFSDWVVRERRETVDAYWDPPASRASASASRPPTGPASGRPRAPRDDADRPSRSPPPPPRGAFFNPEDML